MSELVFKSDDHGGLKFVGDFESLYATETDPWLQTSRSGPMAEYNGHSRARLTAVARRYAPQMPRPLRGLEVGCGLGTVTSLLNAAIPNSYWDGMDISITAIQRARVRHLGKKFWWGDITNTQVGLLIGTFHIIVLGQMLWYVLHDIDKAVENCHNILARNGLLIISQAFLVDEQRYGREICDGFEGLIRMFSDLDDNLARHFRIIEASYDDSDRFLHHDGLLVLRKVD